MTRAITSAVVTAPCIWYLWPPSKKKNEHGHGHDEHKGHGEDGEASGDEGREHSSEAEEAGEGDKTRQGEKEDEKSESESEEGQQDTPETSEDESGDAPHEKEGGGNVEGVQFKGATKGGTEEGEQGDTRKHIPDAKGGSKKRIDSDYGIVQGAAQDDDATVQKPDDVQDKVCKAPWMKKNWNCSNQPSII